MVNQNIKEMKEKKDAQALVRELKDNIEALRLSERPFLTNIDFDFNMQFMKVISSAPGKIGNSRALKQLILTLKKEAEWTVRQNAAI